ncbi:MAG: hypothetical protein A2516_03555, partial [Alphaproteobacteria bacterium RIFOXYD12_FULL_60_8]
ARLSCLLLPLFLLAGCETLTPPPPPNCPNVVIDRATAWITRFGEGKGRDITDITLEGEMLGFTGYCERTDTGLLSNLMTNFTLSLGPRAPSRKAKVEYFVALVKNGEVITKEVMGVDVEFPENVSKVRYRDEAFDLTIPLAAGESGPDYNIYIGFQLSKNELDYNRKRNR